MAGMNTDDLFAGASSDMRLDGDFYGMPDDVYRGVSLDFPQELEDDVYRGLALPCSQYQLGANPFAQPEPYEFFGKPGKDLIDEAPPDMHSASVYQPESNECSVKEDFSFADSMVGPPMVPAHLPATCFWFWAESPAALLQRVYNCLRSEPGRIVKVRPEKYAFKADILQKVHGLRLACRLKVRIYREAPEAAPAALEASTPKRFLVCFCKHSGDGLSFQKTVALALRHLRSEYEAAQVIAEDALASEDVQDPPESGANSGETTLQPLLDMLEDDGSHGAQAKCAEALAAITALVAANTISAASFCAAAGQLQCLSLLNAFASSSQVELSYPARYLQSALHGVASVR